MESCPLAHYSHAFECVASQQWDFVTCSGHCVKEVVACCCLIGGTLHLPVLSRIHFSAFILRIQVIFKGNMLFILQSSMLQSFALRFEACGLDVDSSKHSITSIAVLSGSLKLLTASDTESAASCHCLSFTWQHAKL